MPELDEAPRTAAVAQTFIFVEECRLRFIQNYIATEVRTQLLSSLLESFHFEQRAISLFGRQVLQPRLIAWGGELPYSYSGDTLAPRKLPPAAASLLEQVNHTLREESPGAPHFNHVLLNLYRDGNDSMGAHADDERELGPTPTIASLSLGTERKFCLRLKKKFAVREAQQERAEHKRSSLDLQLTSGSLLLMLPPTQKYFLHSVPQQKKNDGPRLNLTFRALLR